MFFFFFQAEDGIRDTSVTGVQTCALPISAARVEEELPAAQGQPCECQLAGCRHMQETKGPGAALPFDAGSRGPGRSEERRVGKECRSRWWRDHEKKKSERRVACESKMETE